MSNGIINTEAFAAGMAGREPGHVCRKRKQNIHACQTHKKQKERKEQIRKEQIRKE